MEELETEVTRCLDECVTGSDAFLGCFVPMFQAMLVDKAMHEVIFIYICWLLLLLLDPSVYMLSKYMWLAGWQDVRVACMRTLSQYCRCSSGWLYIYIHISIFIYISYLYIYLFIYLSIYHLSITLYIFLLNLPICLISCYVVWVSILRDCLVVVERFISEDFSEVHHPDTWHWSCVYMCDFVYVFFFGFVYLRTK